MLSGVTIGFDDLSNGTELGGVYSSLGIDFSNAIVWSDVIHPVFPAHSPPNVAVDIASGITNEQELTATSVGSPWSDIGAYVTGFSAVTLTAYAANNSVLASMSTAGSNIDSPNEWLEVSAANIAYATFSCNAAQMPALAIDDLHFDTPTPTPNVAVVSSLNPSTYGQPVTFTATVSAVTSGLPTPTGNVTFMDGSTDLGSGQLNGSAVATLTTSTLAVGTHSITAVYSGDSNFGSNTSSSITQTINPAAGAVTIEVNDTTNQADKITLFNPPSTGEPCIQTIPVTITNTGTTPGTFQLSVQPSSAALLLDSSGNPITSVSLPAGASTQVTIRPMADSSAPNDVHIIATQGSTQVGEDSMTIVGVTFGTTEGTNSLDIRNVDTPSVMTADRIPPTSVETAITPVYVTVTPDLSGSGQTVSLTVKGQSDTAGMVNINGQTTLAITASGTENLDGIEQTSAIGTWQGTTVNSPGLDVGLNAGELALTVVVAGQNILSSHGFSVAAIPTNFVERFTKNATGASRGFYVSFTFSSDSGDVQDLGAIDISEQVQYVMRTGIFVNLTSNVGGYTSAVQQGNTDKHILPTRWVRAPGGLEGVNQLNIFRDTRTGADNIPVPFSGYLITRQVFRNRRRWRITTTEQGESVTANGFTSKAGQFVYLFGLDRAVVTQNG